MELLNYIFLTSFLSINFNHVQGTPRPNIILIVADDLGWGDVSFHGSSQVKTPDLDDLAGDGIVLNNYYVSPICTPSRGALLSARHPIHTGLQYDVIQGETPYGLPLEFATIPQYMKELGYATHAIGKWHIGHYTKKHLPTARGFDSFFGYLIGQEDYYEHASLQGIGWGLDLRRDFEGVAEKYFGQYSTTMYTEEAIDTIRNHNTSSDGPLFMYLAYQAIHVGNKGMRFQVPIEVEKKFDNIENEPRRKIVAMGNALNDAVADVVLALKKHNLLDNSIIVFTTDNGGATGGVDDSSGSNWPLRGTKYTLWEGGVKANGFVWSPLLNQSRFTYNGLMHVTDWLPTLFAAAGGDPRRLPKDLYGINLWPDLMKGETENFLRKDILHNINDVQDVFAIRSGDFKLVSGTVRGGVLDKWFKPPGEKLWHNQSTSTTSRVRNILENLHKGFDRNPDLPIVIDCGHAQVTCNMTNTKMCLFNIKNDPCEYHDLSEENPQIVEKLLQMVKLYNATAVEPGNKPFDPRSLPQYNGYYWGPWLES